MISRPFICCGVTYPSYKAAWFLVMKKLLIPFQSIILLLLISLHAYGSPSRSIRHSVQSITLCSRHVYEYKASVVNVLDKWKQWMHCNIALQNTQLKFPPETNGIIPGKWVNLRFPVGLWGGITLPWHESILSNPWRTALNIYKYSSCSSKVWS